MTALLANVLEYHAAVTSRDDALQQQYLLLILAHDRGDKDIEGSALLAAFRLTDPQSHKNSSQWRNYWHFLIENNRFDEAETFLLESIATLRKNSCRSSRK